MDILLGLSSRRTGSSDVYPVKDNKEEKRREKKKKKKQVITCFEKKMGEEAGIILGTRILTLAREDKHQSQGSLHELGHVKSESWTQFWHLVNNKEKQKTRSNKRNKWLIKWVLLLRCALPFPSTFSLSFSLIYRVILPRTLKERANDSLQK